MAPEWGSHLAELLLCALAWVGYLGSAWELARLFVEPVVTRRLLAAFLFFYAEVTVSGFLLSASGEFGSIAGWSLCAAGWLLATSLLARRRWSTRTGADYPLDARAWRSAGLPVLIVAATFALALWLQFTLAVASPPKNADSMTYHLTRVAYYLQHGSLAPYTANYWAQLDHPKNGAIALSFFTLASMRQTNFAQLVQLSAWLALVVATYDIARRVGASRRAALLAGLASGLAIEVLLEATTTQNDLFQAALGAVALDAGLAALQGSRFVAPAQAGIAVGLALGTKASFLLALPALATACVGWAVYGRASKGEARGPARAAVRLTVACLLGVALLAVPAGYWENWRRCGNPLGSPAVLSTKAIATGVGPGEVLHRGLVNGFRFGLDFLQPSGMPEGRATESCARALRRAYVWVVRGLGVDLSAAPTLGPPYVARFDGDFSAHEDLDYLGGWGFLLLVPFSVVALGSKQSRRVAVPFLAGGVVLWLAQAFSGVYDPWRGRYFIQLTTLVAPPFALGCEIALRRWPTRALLSMVVTVCAVSSIHAIWDRKAADWVGSLTCGWACQVTRNTLEFRAAIHNVERLVPQHASMVVSLQDGYSEFPLFGEHLTRRLTPAPSPAQAIAAAQGADADYFLFNQHLLPTRHDCDLGNGVFLRPLRSANRPQCLRWGSRRISDLQLVTTALEAYRAELGAYPPSRGWDGLFSRWGRDSRDWIEGLSPRFIATLPVAARESEGDYAMYVYKSDGHDYKVLVIGSDDVAPVTRLRPTWADPVGEGRSYGVWTAGARNWRLEEP